MSGVAVCIVFGEALLLRSIPKMGIVYLPFGGLLVASITIIPYCEYRKVQRTTTGVGTYPSPEIVASKVRNLRAQLRLSALFLLGFAAAIDVALLLLPGSLLQRILPVSIVLVAIALFGSELLKERRIVASSAPTLAKIVGFERRAKGGRACVYEYKSPVGILITGKGGALRGFAVGMTVPVLYSTSKPEESLPVTDFVFHRIHAELP